MFPRPRRTFPRRHSVALAEPVEPRLLLATYTVTSAADAGPGTLREAIGLAGAAGTDVIEFNLPDPSDAIDLRSPLPAVAGSTGIRGDSQPGFAGTPLVRVNGAAAGAGTIGLRLLSQFSGVHGL